MRMMMKISIPTEAANKAIADGSAARVMQASLETIRPEAAYFYPTLEGRVLLLVCDVQENSDVPVIADPFFKQLGASVSVTPVMNVQDFQKAMQRLAH